MDSFQFLSTSLEELVSLPLKSGKDNFVHTTAHLGTDDIIFAKGVYPYSYVDSCEKFADKRILRQIEKRTVVGGGLSASARHVGSFRL